MTVIAPFKAPGPWLGDATGVGLAAAGVCSNVCVAA
jgi:hypothetical protein